MDNEDGASVEAIGGTDEVVSDQLVPDEVVAEVAPPDRSDRLRLILLSALMLFVEIALIRWTGSNVVYLSYFSNFVLLGSFLGIGLGFLRARSKVNLWPWAPVALSLLVAFVLVFPVKINRSGSDVIYFGEFSSTGLPTWLTLPIIFIFVAATLAMLAEGVARTFARFEPLEAYRLDIMGSIIGIVAYSALAFMSAPPVFWGLIAAALFTYLYGRDMNWIQVAAVVILLLMLTGESREELDRWSPYYKITLEPGDQGSYGIAVNGIPHQAIQSTELRRQLEPIYFLPYQRAVGNPLQDVLVVGAGNGTDVAIALNAGAQHVDAVEIDPRLFGLGEEFHPDQPYADERVDGYIDDGRAFLERNDKKYDLILFALPDSLTLVSGQAALRLESYLFTKEAMVEARRHLKPGGVFAMYNFYREQWLIDRLVRTLDEVYGHPPCIDTLGVGGGLALMMVSDESGALQCETIAQVAAEAPPPATDDYPFLYLKERGIPSLYLQTVLLILLASLAMVRVAAGPLRGMRRYTDLFFMGVAFLLLETKNVVQFALLFGTTWFVNAVVFTGILLSVLGAIEVARHVRFKHPVRLYYFLLASLVVAYLIPGSALLSLSIVPRFVAAIVVAFTPIFLANLVFAERFKDVGSSTTAFGANLLGAMVGGVLEYSALVVGYRALLIAAAILYGLAFLTGREHLQGHSSAASPAFTSD
ncbi:MAG TPA: spermidine synthase [Actinomycetota bacterium]|nr:spermidine synthase [Actinomycetota bacterium]